MEIIAFMFIALTASFLLGQVFNRIGMPKVLGPIVLGLLFAQKPFADIFLGSETIGIVNFVKDIAIIFLLFFVGLKIDINDFRKTSKKSFFIGIFASLIPFVIGYSFIVLLGFFGYMDFFMLSDSSLFMIAFVVGICLSITAEGVIIEILEELGLIKSIVGETIIEAGVIDDIVGILLISGLIALIPSGSNSAASGIGVAIVWKLLEMLIFAGIIFVIGYFVVPRIMRAVEKEKSTVNFFAVSIMITLFLAVITRYFDLGGSILGALVGGMIIRHTLLSGDKYEQREEKYITDIIEVTTFGFFAPFFFLWIGLNTNLSVLSMTPFFAMALVIIGIISKMAGSLIGNHIAHGKPWEGMIIGWGMNTRGGVDIMIATLALSTGVISIDLFSVLVFMSFATTVISPVVFKILVKKHHGL